MIRYPAHVSIGPFVSVVLPVRSRPAGHAPVTAKVCMTIILITENRIKIILGPARSFVKRYLPVRQVCTGQAVWDKGKQDKSLLPRHNAAAGGFCSALSSRTAHRPIGVQLQRPESISFKRQAIAPADPFSEQRVLCGFRSIYQFISLSETACRSYSDSSYTPCCLRKQKPSARFSFRFSKRKDNVLRKST